jgi:hypothetical protein
MTDPALQAEIQSNGMPASSRTERTPRCAIPRVAPPPRVRPIFIYAEN